MQRKLKPNGTQLWKLIKRAEFAPISQLIYISWLRWVWVYIANYVWCLNCQLSLDVLWIKSGSKATRITLASDFWFLFCIGALMERENVFGILLEKCGGGAVQANSNQVGTTVIRKALLPFSHSAVFAFDIKFNKWALFGSIISACLLGDDLSTKTWWQFICTVKQIQTKSGKIFASKSGPIAFYSAKEFTAKLLKVFLKRTKKALRCKAEKKFLAFLFLWTRETYIIEKMKRPEISEQLHVTLQLSTGTSCLIRKSNTK